MYDSPLWDHIQLAIGAAVTAIVAIIMLMRVRDFLRGRRGGQSSFPPLITAVMLQDQDAAREQLAAGKNPNQRDNMGRTGLHHAVLKYDAAMVELLLDHNILVNTADVNGHTALHFAAQEYLPAIARLLIDRGADVNAVDVHGNSVIWRAVYDSSGRGAVIELLLAHNADPHQPNKYGVSAFRLAETVANYDVKQFFERR
ncbi:MAG: ankyrin repeat domain-containing protein [Proteobacteria bacterium]|nr:ankyrin repeat domain-containing protein [Pseudomonadota bacterium]